jgi:phage terminase large subunit-like protein
MKIMTNVGEQIDSRFLDDLYLFYRLFVIEKFGGKPVKAPHIKKLSRHLMALKLGRLDKHLAISMAPRHSKSSMVTLAYPLWLIFQNPDLNILIINNTSTLSEKFGIALRDSVKEYGHLFNIYLSDVKHSSTHLMFCDKTGKLYNGSIRLTGASGSITGQDADYIIIDDPYKGEEEEFTPTALQKKIDWFNRIVEQRIEPHTHLIILHTRWHSNDLIGYLEREQSSDYLFVTFPAITQENKPLWGEKYTLTELESKLSKVGERLFSSIWQQKPLDDTTDFFDLTRIRYEGLQPDERILKTIRTWDISKGATIHSDYTVGALMVITNHNRIGVTKIKRGQYGQQTKTTVFNTAGNDGYDVEILIETGVAAAGDLLFDEWQLQLPGYRVHRSKAINSKPDRATPLKNLIIDGNFFINITDDSELIQIINSEFQSFPDGLHDDIVDAISYGIIYLHNFIEDDKLASVSSIDVW